MLKGFERNWNVNPSDVPTTGIGKIDYICDRGRGFYKMQRQEVIQADTSDHYILVGYWKRKHK